MTDTPVNIKRKHPLARCEDCDPEWYKRGVYANADGPEDASFLVVGEAPGRQEAKQRKVFVGKSGELLNKVLAHHGYDRSEIRLTNAVACAPPDIRSKKPEKPPSNVIRACQPRLRQELKGRETVILAGKTAFQAALETSEAITKARQGPPRSHPDYPGTTFVATVHPAFCLRSSDNFPSLVRDIGKAKSTIYLNWEPPQFRAYEDRESCLAVLDELLRLDGYITLDIETSSEKDTDFTHPSNLLCVGIGYAPNKVVVLGETALKYDDVRAKLGKLLDVKPVICHNGKFDIQVLVRLGIMKVAKLYGDTMLGNYCLDERPGHHSLDAVSSEMLGAPDWKGELKPYFKGKKTKDYAIIPRHVLYRYNAYDVACTYNLYHDHIEPKLIEQGLKKLHDFLVEASVELIYVELDGIAIDEPYLEGLITEYTEVLDHLEHELKPWVENPRSVPQVTKALMKLKLFTEDTAAETLNALLEGNRTQEQREFLTKLLTYRKEQKLFGTYVKGPQKRAIDGRVFPTYLVHGTVTGRLSSRNPNAQNISRNTKIKKIYVPTAGNVFVQGDYSQAELRVIACLAKDKYLQGVYCDEQRDIHDETATLFYGPNFTKEQRVHAKTFNFGVAYGRGPHAVAEAFGVSVETAQQYVNQFLARIPDTVKWRKEVHDTIFKKGEALQTPFGRKRRFWLITRDNKVDIQNESLAYYPQSVASDLCLSSLIRLRRSFGDGASAPRVRTTVHDSILVECADSDKREVGEFMRKTMMDTAAEVFSDFVPFNADIETGPSWGELEKV